MYSLVRSKSNYGSRRLLTTLSNPSFSSSLQRVSSLVSLSLQSLTQLRKDSEAWVSAIEALESISKSPRRHLFRPQLVFLGALSGLESGKGLKQEAAGALWSEYVDRTHVESFAAGVELQHLYMVVHDDVMDHGTIRRGLPTVSVVLSRTGLVRSFQSGREIADHLAILVGDAANAASLKLMLNGAVFGLNRPKALEVILDSALRAGAAQFEDVIGWEGVERRLAAGEFLSEIQTLHALDIAAEHGFSAPLIAGFRMSPSSLSNDKKAEFEDELRRFGTLIGTSFFDLSDVTDIVCESSETGKDSLQDLREGRLSQPLFNLRKLADPEEWEDVSSILRGFQTSGNFNGPMTLYDRRRILTLMDKHRVIGRTLDAAENKLSEAEQLVSKWKQTMPGFAEGCHKFVEGLRHEVKSLVGRLLKG